MITDSMHDSIKTKLQPVIMAIQHQMEQKPVVILGIDGCAASGKSTAAALLADLFDAEIIHMDDFFLPLNLRTEERFLKPGGNVHYERFEDEVMGHLIKKESCSFLRFDCSHMDYSDKIKIELKPLIIIEGAYCLHPAVTDGYDIKVFCQVPAKVQENRILLRNGAEGLVNFKERWIPLENQYFKLCGIREKCQFVVGME